MKIRKTSFPFFYCYWYKNQTSVRLNQIKTYARYSLLWLFFFLPWLLAVSHWQILPILYGAGSNGFFSLIVGSRSFLPVLAHHIVSISCCSLG